MIKIESNAEYHASPALNKSRLHRFSVSPEWFKYCEDNPEEERSDAFAIGSAFHKLVLEPEGFDSEFAVAPSIDKRTKAGKEAYAAFSESCGSKQVLAEEQFALACAMRDAVRSNKYADFLSRGRVEQSFYFVDDMTGVECRVRPDCLKVINGRGAIIDFKSCASADTESFRRDAIKYGYDLQAAMYKTGVEKELGIPCDFIFVAVEKTAPHMINILQADELLIRHGEDLFREYLGLYKRCSETGNWFGYLGEFNQINNLGLPAWLAKEVE